MQHIFNNKIRTGLVPTRIVVFICMETEQINSRLFHCFVDASLRSQYSSNLEGSYKFKLRNYFRIFTKSSPRGTDNDTKQHAADKSVCLTIMPDFNLLVHKLENRFPHLKCFYLKVSECV